MNNYLYQYFVSNWLRFCIESYLNPADGHWDSKSGFLSFDFLSPPTLGKEDESRGMHE